MLQAGSFAQDYVLSKELGRGAFSQVKLATPTSSSSSSQVAVKIVNKEKMAESDRRALQREVDILLAIKAQHPGVILLLDKREDDDFHYLVMEYMSGGELFARIVAQARFSEHEAQQVVRMMASALSFLHERGIAHRDLKPENILCSTSSTSYVVKFADFGFASYDHKGLRTACGSPAYVAPEVISGRIYQHPCDMWSLGVLLYILLSGYPPFYSTDRRQLFRQIREADFRYDAQYWGHVSLSAKDLVSRLLVCDVGARYTADQVLKHEWLAQEETAPAERRMSTLTLTTANSDDAASAMWGKNLRLFNARRKFRQGLHKVIRRGKMPELVQWVKKLSSFVSSSSRSAAASSSAT